MQERFQIIVLAIKNGKKYEVYDTDGLVQEVSELTVNCKCCSKSATWLDVLANWMS